MKRVLLSLVFMVSGIARADELSNAIQNTNIEVVRAILEKNGASESVKNNGIILADEIIRLRRDELVSWQHALAMAKHHSPTDFAANRKENIMAVSGIVLMGGALCCGSMYSRICSENMTFSLFIIGCMGLLSSRALTESRYIYHLKKLHKDALDIRVLLGNA